MPANSVKVVTKERRYNQGYLAMIKCKNQVTISSESGDYMCRRTQHTRERRSSTSNLWLKAFATSNFLRTHGNGEGSKFLR